MFIATAEAHGSAASSGSSSSGSSISPISLIGANSVTLSVSSRLTTNTYTGPMGLFFLDNGGVFPGGAGSWWPAFADSSGELSKLSLTGTKNTGISGSWAGPTATTVNTVAGSSLIYFKDVCTQVSPNFNYNLTAQDGLQIGFALDGVSCPQLITNSKNGHSILRFTQLPVIGMVVGTDGTAIVGDAHNDFGCKHLNVPITIFLACKLADVVSNSFVYGRYWAADATHLTINGTMTMTLGSNPGFLTCTTYDNVGATAIQLPAVANSWTIYALRIANNSTLDGWFNNLKVSSTGNIATIADASGDLYQNPATGSFTSCLFSKFPLGNLCTADFGDLIVANTALSDSLISQVNRNLGTFWGVGQH